MPTNHQAAKLARVDQLAEEAKRALHKAGPIWDDEPAKTLIDALRDEARSALRTAALAQAEAEPVAPWGYYYEHKTGDCDQQLTFARWDEPGRANYVETVLYDRPQPAQPTHQVPELTDDEIEAVWMAGDWYRPGEIAGRHAQEFAHAIIAELRSHQQRQEKT